jgi:hypothetical protein
MNVNLIGFEKVNYKKDNKVNEFINIYYSYIPSNFTENLVGQKVACRSVNIKYLDLLMKSGLGIYDIVFGDWNGKAIVDNLIFIK